MARTQPPIDSNESLYDGHHEVDAVESELDAAWANGRKLSSEASRDQASYKYTPSGEFNYLAHYIYRQRENNYLVWTQPQFLLDLN